MTKINYPIGGYAPGSYSCKCVICESEFSGDKRAVQCEPCAINNLQENMNSYAEEVGKLKAELFSIKNSLSVLKTLL